MAKKDERKLAKHYYLQGDKSQKEIAVIVNVREATIGSWIRKYGWDNLRAAQTASKENAIDNIKNIILGIAEDRLRLTKELSAATEKELQQDIRRQIASLDDGVSKWNKTLENLDKNNKITLQVYLYVMEDIFKALRTYEPKLAYQLIDFQENHVHNIASRY